MKDKLFSKLFFLILFLFLVFASRDIYAATGRITIDTGGGTGTAGGSISVKAQLRTSEGGPLSVGERAQFIVRNPRTDDRCDTNPAASDSQGYVYGTCYANQAGTITIYAKSLDNSDESSDYLLTFISGPTPTNTPTVSPTVTTSTTTTITKTKTPTPTEVDEEEQNEEETPTPTPDEEKTAGFFSSPLGIIVLLLVLIFAGAGGFILWKENKFPFNKFKKFQLNKIKPTDKPKVEPPTQTPKKTS